MIANYHTHTQRCRHATGCERDYVLAAIEGGLKILGFSDHCPLPFPDDYDPRIRMSMDQLPEYVDEILSLREEFKDQIDILLGFELEYYPDYFGAILKEFEKYPVDYLIQGQHYVGSEIGEPYMGSPLGTDLLKRYVDQTIEGLETGRFLYLAHPDLPNFEGDWHDYEREMRRLCEGALRLNIPLEINLLGMRTSRNYPNWRFWKIAGETGNLVVIGSDAHNPWDLIDTPSEQEALKKALEYGLKIEDSLIL